MGWSGSQVLDREEGPLLKKFKSLSGRAESAPKTSTRSERYNQVLSAAKPLAGKTLSSEELHQKSRRAAGTLTPEAKKKNDQVRIDKQAYVAALVKSKSS